MPAIDATINATATDESKSKKPIRQAVGAIVVDSTNRKVLMLSSRKTENAYRLPRGDCDENETPEQAIVRVLRDEAGVKVDRIARKLGTYCEANKKGKTIAHHWIYEIQNPRLLDSWPALDRKRIWFTLNEAIAACADRHISRLALNNSSLAA